MEEVFLPGSQEGQSTDHITFEAALELWIWDDNDRGRSAVAKQEKRYY